ncbi:ADENINE PHOSPHORIBOSYLTRANSFERASE 3-RELATED [Salix purpurea]|uniref:adenine phosphoribosyltransferase n=1 Tax=Salix purpurea TaxID=77065 RepID=A0A9Q0TII8_SALPP|nr:ADENINE PHOSPHORIBOSYLTRANSFERASE 3-RELATED [Salix purpurea]
MSAYRDEDPRIHDIKTRIRVVPNFPKPGIMFQDITTLLLNPKAFKDTIDLFVERYKGKNISVVAGKKYKTKLTRKSESLHFCFLFLG